MATASLPSNYYPWQKTQWQQLVTQYQNQRFPHALLFHGNAGLGKQSFACALAARLLCQQSNQANPVNTTSIACGHCTSCHLLRAGSHPDFYHLSLSSVQTSIGVDRVRTLIDQLHKTTYQGDYQIAIIYPAESLTVEASNALLKTLEEPTDNTLLILVTAQVHQLLTTVRSRCQWVYFSPAPQDSVMTWVINNLEDAGLDSQMIKGLLALNGWSPLLTVSAVKNNDLDLLRLLLSNLIKPINRADPLTMTEACLKYDTDTVLRYLYNLIQGFIYKQLHLKSVLDYFCLKSGFVSRLKSVLDRYNTNDLLYFLQVILILRQQLQTFPGLNVRLQLDTFFISWFENDRSFRTQF